jgi:outer membrane protein
MVSIKKHSIIAFAVIGLLSLFSLKSFAQKVGVVDGNEVLKNYSEAVSADAKITAQAKVWQDSLAIMTKALQEKAENYKKSFETMTKDAQKKAQDDVDAGQKMIVDYQNAKFNQQDGEILKLRSNLLTPIVNKVKDAIATVAKKKKIEIVLDKGQTTYVGDAVADITKDVTDSLKK